MVADVNNPTYSSATGWQGSSLTPNFEVTKLSASISLAAFSQPKIAFGIELIDVGKVDVAVTMKLPAISSTLSADYDANGVCSQDVGASKTGVKLENKADESLSLQIDVDLGDDDSKPSWSKQLLDLSQALGSDCIPLAIPGLAGLREQQLRWRNRRALALRRPRANHQAKQVSAKAQAIHVRGKIMYLATVPATPPSNVAPISILPHRRLRLVSRQAKRASAKAQASRVLVGSTLLAVVLEILPSSAALRKIRHQQLALPRERLISARIPVGRIRVERTSVVIILTMTLSNVIRARH